MSGSDGNEISDAFSVTVDDDPVVRVSGNRPENSSPRSGFRPNKPVTRASGCDWAPAFDSSRTRITAEGSASITFTAQDTGMRISELASMTLESFSAEGVLVSGKTGDRMVPMSSNVTEMVNRQGDERGLAVGRP